MRPNDLSEVTVHAKSGMRFRKAIMGFGGMETIAAGEGKWRWVPGSRSSYKTTQILPI